MNLDRKIKPLGTKRHRRVSRRLRPLTACAVSLVFSTTAWSGEPKILLFSKTEGFRHGSITAATEAIEGLSMELGVQVQATDDAAVFSQNSLAEFEAVVFLMTTGDVLDAPQQEAFENYIRAGGGYVGVHSASDTEYDWPWYGQLVGAYFANHPPQQQATVSVETSNHPSTSTLPTTWSRFDEWYNFQSNPRGAVNVLLTLNESTYSGGSMGDDHPISWYHAYDGGRSWYTGMGHTSDSYADEDFLDHLAGGIRYAGDLTSVTTDLLFSNGFEQP